MTIVLWMWLFAARSGRTPGGSASALCWGRASVRVLGGHAVAVPVVVESDPAVAEGLVAVLGSGALVLPDADALRRHLSVDLGERVVVLGPSIDLVLAADLARRLRVAHPGLAVILVRREGAAVAAPEAARAGIRQVVSERDHAGLVVAVRRAVGAADVVSPARRVRGGVVTVFAAERGCGATTLAINLAAVLGQEGGLGACLVDLSLASSDLANTLRLAPKRNMSGVLSIARGSLDLSTVTELVTPYAPELGVVLAPNEHESAQSIPIELTGTVVRLLRQVYEWVVIHTPPELDDHVLGALDLSDVLVLPTTLDIPALKSLDRTMETLRRLNYPRERWRIVLNQSQPATKVDPDEAEKFLGVRLSTQIPHSADVTSCAARGIPIFLAAPNHEVSRAIRGFAEALAASSGRSPREETGFATRFERGFSPGLTRAVHETVIDELAAAALDELRDAYLEIDRAVHIALAAVLAHRQAILQSADRAAIVRTVVQAILRYGSAPATYHDVPRRPTSQTNPVRPGERPIETLGVRLRAYAVNAALAWGLTSHLDIDNQPSGLPLRREEGMLRLGYEAITHACKHADANHLWIHVALTGPAVIRVEDDGTGPVSKRRNGYRWRTLTDIATQHDLYLAIERRTPRGTTIEITAA